MSSRLIELTGLRFGKWTVVGRHGDTSPPFWDCRCECGNSKLVRGVTLRAGESRSCGCIGAERFRLLDNRGDKNPQRKMSRIRNGVDLLPVNHPWVLRSQSIKRRCADSGIEFGFGSAAECATFLNSITPERCPVFGFLLEAGRCGFNPKSPSADRIDPTQGYVRNNLQVISFKANAMKANATADELALFASWILKTE